jgi:hypothetical protein
MLLLIVTSAVWGLIVFRIIKTVRGSDATPTSVSIAPPAISRSHDVDTFSLIDDYRDPFLGYLEIPKPIYSAPLAIKAAAPPPRPNVPFPNVRYLGRVKNHDSQKRVAIIMVDKSIKNMSEGDQYNNVKLLKLLGDSVLVSFYDERKMVAKSAKKETQKEPKK